MRHLASIKRISDLQPIEGRDRIVLAAIDGWHVIVKKDEFAIGNLCVYAEIDSVMPQRPEFEFLAKNKYRIKTMKMAGVISQGICFPLAVLPSGRDYAENEDVTEILGVKQYEATMDTGNVKDNVETNKKKYPAFLMRSKLFRKLFCSKKEYRGFPTFISKTDETRIQNAPFYLKDKAPWIATEKVDGQSGTFVLQRHKKRGIFSREHFEYMVCSRNNRLYRPDSSTYWFVSRKYDIESILKMWIGDNEWIAIQGECVGPKVQKNKYHVKEPDLYVFNVLTPAGRMDSLSAHNLCKRFGLPFVPIVDTAAILPDTVDEILEYAHGQSQLADTIREGIVFRSMDGKQSFKAVDPLFLLKYDE